MDAFKKPRRVQTVRVDNDEDCSLLLSDYMKNIAGDLYLTTNVFEGESYIHIRKFFTDRDGNLQPKKERTPFTLSQFVLFLQSMGYLESRYWAMNEGLQLKPYEKFFGPWKLVVDVFGDISIWKYYYNSESDQLLPSRKGISFLLLHYRPLARDFQSDGEISNSTNIETMQLKRAQPT